MIYQIMYSKIEIEKNIYDPAVEQSTSFRVLSENKKKKWANPIHLLFQSTVSNLIKISLFLAIFE